MTPATFIDVNAKMLGAEIALEAHTLPPIWSVAPDTSGFVLIPTTPRGPNTAAVLVTPVTFIEVNAKMLGAEIALDA